MTEKAASKRRRERHSISPRQNLKKWVNSRKDALGNTTKICYNAFNAPVSTTDANEIVTEYSYNDDNWNRLSETSAGFGSVVKYAYDRRGRLARQGSKTYRYGYLDKVMSVTDNGSTYTYEYHADGQLAKAT